MIDPEIAKCMPPNMDVDTINVEHLRTVGTQFAELMPKLELSRVDDHVVPGPEASVPVRLYYPDVSENRGMIVFIHGGGWCMGNLETHDAMCRQLSQITEFVVCAVAYRLAPEHKFPAGLQDAEAATRWAIENAAEFACDPDRIVIMGESAGGNLAAVIAQRLREKFSYQILVFPLTDFSLPFPSYQRHADALGLTTESVQWCRSQYLENPEVDQRNPLASPYLTADLKGCPPAFVMTAEVDPMCDDGEAYGMRLIEAGVPVTMRRYLGMPHGFLVLPIELERIRKIYDDIRHVLWCEVG